MKNIKNIVDSINPKRFTGGLDEGMIADAERRLGVSFAYDYKELLSNYGSLSLKGDEFLGIFADYYDVVMATEDVRRDHADFPKDLYVIEDMGIDGILLVQNKQGEVFTYQPNAPLQKVKNNLCDYIASL